MRFLLPILLVACAPPGPGEPVDPSHDMSPYLTEDAPSALPERARTPEGAIGSLLPDGEPMWGEPWPNADTWVVADSSPREVAVIWTGGVVQLGAWLPRSAFEPTVADPTWASGSTGEGALGVRIPAGWPLEVEGRDGERARVRATYDTLEIDAWVPTHRLDEVWFPAEPSEPETPEGRFVRVLPGALLLDAPFGEPIGALDADGSDLYATATAAERAHLRVSAHLGKFAIDAWVHEDEAADSTFHIRGISGWGCSCGGGFGWGGPPNVRQDAWLYASPGGAVVGRVRREVSLALRGPPSDWSELEYETPFGTAALWVDPADRI